MEESQALPNKSPKRPLPRICLFLPSFAGGGAERVFVQLANEFAALGVNVDFTVAAASGPYLAELSENIRVIDFEASGVLMSMSKLATYLRTNKPDVMLSGLDHANVVALLAKFVAHCGTRCVISVRSVPSAANRGSKSFRVWMIRQLTRVTYRFADKIIVNSEAVATDVSQVMRMPRERMEVAYNPLNIASIEALSSAEIAHPWVKPGCPPIILGVGRLDTLKDFQTLIRAFSVVRSGRECKLVILGEGPERERYEKLVGELELQQDVCLPGFVLNPFAWMRCAAVLVSSSLTEGCPNVVMQALACGTPVVSTDCVGGSAEILEGGEWGQLVAVGDFEAMAAAIEKTMDAQNHPDGRRRANDFSPEKIVRQYLQILLPEYQVTGLES